MHTGHIDSNGVKLYYVTIGQGEPLLLLNGGPGLPHDYLQELSALAPFAQLVFYDQRGTGLSSKADQSAYTIDANVEDLETLRRGLNLDSVRILGHSWGGMLAQAYILKYPDHVTKLILADTFSSIADTDTTLANMLAAVSPETRAVIAHYESVGLYGKGDSYPPEYQASLDIAYEPVQISITPPDYLQNSFAKIAYDVYKTMWGDESEFRVTGTLCEFDVFARLGEIRVPTLVIVGASDMPSIAMVQRTVDAIPNAQLEIFQRSRHYPFLEEPEKFLQVVSAFLQA